MDMPIYRRGISAFVVTLIAIVVLPLFSVFSGSLYYTHSKIVNIAVNIRSLFYLTFHYLLNIWRLGSKGSIGMMIFQVVS